MDDQMSLLSANTEFASTPDERAYQACYWIDHHKREWNRLRSLLADLESEEHIHKVKRGDIYILARQRGWSISEARVVSFDNNMWSVLSRLLIMDNLALARILHPKRCGIDLLDLYLIYHEVCGKWSREISRMGELFAACPQLTPKGS